MGRPLFSMFASPAPRVADSAALIMRAVTRGGAASAEPMREAALTEGAVLHHLIQAVSAQQVSRAGGEGLGGWVGTSACMPVNLCGCMQPSNSLAKGMLAAGCIGSVEAHMPS
jgi:hypothetical protein